MSITYKTIKDKPSLIRNILNPLVKQWFFSKFKDFSKPQLFAPYEIHTRNHILVSAPTGSTKTLTAFLTILNELVDSSQKKILEDKIYCIYVSPLKALNNDIQRNLLEPLKEMELLQGNALNIRVMVRTGDTTQTDKNKMLKKPPHILITTPESLAILLSSIKFREHLTNVDWFIVDEIHSIADNKRGVHLSLSMERLSHSSPHMTRIGLSATISPLEEVAKFLVGTNRPCKIANIKFEKKKDLKVISPVNDLINTSYEELHTQMYKLIHELIQSHTTTLIFTNTRAATEKIVINLKNIYPKHYNNNIGAHHGSLSKENRTELETNLKEGKMKAVVCSTSLELGIDIGAIDLVISLGSPKSVARALQRIGRSGHNLDSISKGRIIVTDRDDLIECSVLLKSAIENKIDNIIIPLNALDVLAQQIYGIAIDKVWDEDELFNLIKQSYCYATLKRGDYNKVLSYLAGEYVQLENRYIYAKIWRKDNKIGKKGKLARVIYMTNIGTIPDQSSVQVKVGEYTIGSIEESFLERLKKNDIFVLGGNRYKFNYSKGLCAYVSASVSNPPTVPSWISEMLPLSFDLAIEIGKFRRLLAERFNYNQSEKEIKKFIATYLYIDDNTVTAIYSYMQEQINYIPDIPTDKQILIEYYKEDDSRKIIFHSLFGRRVNDVISRAIAYTISRNMHKEVIIGLNDNGFYLGIEKNISMKKIIELITSEDILNLMKNAIEGSEILKRRFRHCATRSLMILRRYKGQEKSAGRQQVSSMILLNAVKRVSNEFIILKEACREVLYDQMDLKNAKQIINDIKTNKIKIKEHHTEIPSPFAFNIVLQGVMDILKFEDKIAFIKKMHNLVQAKIYLNKGKKQVKEKPKINYHKLWDEEELDKEQEKENEKFKLIMQLKEIDEPIYIKEEIYKLIEGNLKIRQDVFEYLQNNILNLTYKNKLKEFIIKKIENY
jgi:ATP-dependent helicase Lhr and Lhr-like helicase